MSFALRSDSIARSCSGGLPSAESSYGLLGRQGRICQAARGGVEAAASGDAADGRQDSRNGHHGCVGWVRGIDAGW